MNRSLQIVNLSKKEFGDFYKLNHRFWLQRLANDINDSLIFVDHPHVIIVGNQGNTKDIKVPYAMARREDIPVSQVDWEGEMTYRGPGQLIIYPVMHLLRQGMTMDKLMEKMANVAIHLLHQYGIKAQVLPGGIITVDGCKIGSIDLEDRHKVTRFSMVLNVNPRLSLLRMLQLKDDNGQGVTSMYHQLKKKVDVRQLKMHFVSKFKEEFAYTMEDSSSLLFA
ncbi:MAG: lipoyl(octanoyl) transferase LipB [Dehalobacterium sp.]|jgi:lipoyl(octanoyl) transferase